MSTGTHAMYEKTEDSNAPVSRCVSCARGHYMDELGSKKGECKACAPGTVTDHTGQAECESCEPGTYASPGNLFKCLECPAGQYSSEKRATSCKICALGRASNITGRGTQCDVCEPGRFAAESGWKECEICPLGACPRAPSVGYEFALNVDVL